jgi:hypothetical protein
VNSNGGRRWDISWIRFGGVAVAGVLAVLGLLVSMSSAQSATPSVSMATALHSPGYLRKHCSIEVPVNVGGGRGTHVKDGVSVRGINTVALVHGNPKQFVRLYRWQISKHDQFYDRARE